MDDVIPHDRSNVSAHEDRRAFHPGAFHCSPWPFPFGIPNIIPFDTGIVPPPIAASRASPLGIDSNLRIADLVLANDNMRCIARADSTTVGRCGVILDPESFDPYPVATHDIEGAVELRHLPCMDRGVIQAADVDLLCAKLIKPAFLHFCLIMSDRI